MKKEEIFLEILKSPKLKNLMGIPYEQEIDPKSMEKEIKAIRLIIDGKANKSSDINILKNIKKIYDI